jgi:aminopeptidase N
MIPGLSSALYNRGIAKQNLGDREGACIDLQAALAAGLKENRQYVEYLCNPEVTGRFLTAEFYSDRKVSAENGYRPVYTRADSLRGALRPERTCFDVLYYDLQVRIIPKGKKIEGRNTVFFEVLQPTRRIQLDLFEQFAITGILYNHKPLRYTREFNAVFIDFPVELPPGKAAITITYRGKPQVAPNPPWDGGFVWEKDQNKDLWLGVACEHLGASSWWPNKDHLSDKPDSMLITLQVPKGYQAISNGDLRAKDLTGKAFDQFSWFVSYPINNYNATFYVGKYTAFGDTVVTGRDTVKLDYNVLTANLAKAKVHFKQTREIIDFYNRAFGIYPFQRDGFSLVESPYEGMEHQSAIAYGNGYENSLGKTYRNHVYDFIILHEAAHEWWGNSVSAADMADIWIHEGFATYAEYMFLEEKLGPHEYMVELADKSRYIYNFWPLVQNRHVNENTFASSDVYHKGAMLLHCLRCTIDNDSLFFRVLRDFFQENKYKTVNSDDFVQTVNRITGADYTSFFNKYLMDTKLPVLEYIFEIDKEDLILKYRWTGVSDGFVMPFAIENDKKKSFRMTGTTAWQQLTLPQTSWFNFYNLEKGFEGCPVNAFTYYHTRNLVQ